MENCGEVNQKLKGSFSFIYIYIYINESWDRKLLVPYSFVDGKYEGQLNFNVIDDISKCYVANLWVMLFLQYFYNYFTTNLR